MLRQETNETIIPLEMIYHIFTYSDVETLQSWLLVDKFFNNMVPKLRVQKYFPEATKSDDADWNVTLQRCLESKFQQSGMSFIYELIKDGRSYDVALLARGIAKDQILGE